MNKLRNRSIPREKEWSVNMKCSCGNVLTINGCKECRTKVYK